MYEHFNLEYRILNQIKRVRPFLNFYIFWPIGLSPIRTAHLARPTSQYKCKGSYGIGNLNQ